MLASLRIKMLCSGRSSVASVMVALLSPGGRSNRGRVTFVTDTGRGFLAAASKGEWRSGR
jgi:hypothetical protein